MGNARQCKTFWNTQVGNPLPKLRAKNSSSQPTTATAPTSNTQQQPAQQQHQTEKTLPTTKTIQNKGKAKVARA
eukprot:4300143-Amphidinium_carterae.1